MGKYERAIDVDLRKRCQAIKNRYADGVPLNKHDRITVTTALRNHPKAQQKFGIGINAIVVHKYVYGTRCFFVIRSDNSVEDFSLKKCFGLPQPPRNARLIRAMQLFDYRIIQMRYHLFMSERQNRRAS